MNENDIIKSEELILSNELPENKIYNFEDIEEIKENLLRGLIICQYNYTSLIQSHIVKSMFNKKNLFIQSKEGYAFYCKMIFYSKKNDNL